MFSRIFTLSLYVIGCSVALQAEAQRPEPARGWEWQLSPPLDLSKKVGFYDLDPDQVTARQIQDLTNRGIYTICYVSVGSWEDWRADAMAFPTVVLGRPLENWPGERYLDIRQLDVLLPLMKARFARCAQLGFDAIEPDNMDAHNNPNGFGLKPQHMISYMRELAKIAHDMTLDIAQKNAPDLTNVLSSVLDFAVTESCLRRNECRSYGAYSLILAAEYQVPKSRRRGYCRRAQSIPGLTLIFKDRDLTSWRKDCSMF